MAYAMSLACAHCTCLGTALDIVSQRAAAGPACSGTLRLVETSSDIRLRSRQSSTPSASSAVALTTPT